MELVLFASNRHGRPIYYATCEKGEALCRLMDTLSVPVGKFDLIKMLGFEIVISEDTSLRQGY